jgi:FkbM family methyltransferase
VPIGAPFRRGIRALLPRGPIAGARRLVELLDPHVRLSYSQDGEDMILRRLFEGQKCGFYVDVGAHHPFRFSNTCYFYRLGWRGINVDPNPDGIEAFRKARPLDTNLCVGVSDTVGSLCYHVFNEPALNTFDAALAAERADLPDYRLLQTREVPVRRLDGLLSEQLRHGQVIDFLSIDVEGLDLQVLKSNDWNHFRPAVLLVEARAADINQLATDPINAFATSAGYRLVAKTLNTLIYEDGSNASSSSGAA